MSEKELVLQKLKEKQQLRKANKNITQLFIMASSLLFITLLAVWFAHRFPPILFPRTYGAACATVILSSIFLFIGQRKVIKDLLKSASLYITVGFLLGLLFAVFQLLGWKEVLDANLSIRNILFPFTLIHFGHVCVGLLLLLAVIRKIAKYQVHSRSLDYLANVFLFWHFLGTVWLLFFLLG